MLLSSKQRGYACEECKDPRSYVLRDEARGDYVCNQCGHCSGAVLSEQLERMGSKFADSAQGANSRAGGAAVDPTLVGSMDIIMSGPPTGKYGRLQRRRADPAELKKQKEINRSIRQICDLLGLPTSVVCKAKAVSMRVRQMQSRLENSQVHRPGWQRAAPVAAASVKLACKDLGIARQMQDICRLAKLPNCKLAWRAHQILEAQGRCGVVVNGVTASAGAMAADIAEGRLVELRAKGRTACVQLDLDYATGGRVVALLTLVTEREILVGTRPSTIAGAAAWVVGTKTGATNLSKRQAGVRLGISEAALRRSASYLEPLLGAAAVAMGKTEVATVHVVQAGAALFGHHPAPKREPDFAPAAAAAAPALVRGAVFARAGVKPEPEPALLTGFDVDFEDLFGAEIGLANEAAAAAAAAALFMF